MAAGSTLYVIISLAIAFAIFCEITARGSMAIGLAALVTLSLVSVFATAVSSPGVAVMPSMAAVGLTFRGLFRFLAGAITIALAKDRGKPNLSDLETALPKSDWRHAVVGNIFAATVMAAMVVMQQQADLPVSFTVVGLLAIAIQSALELLPNFASPGRSKAPSAAKGMPEEDKNT